MPSCGFQLWCTEDRSTFFLIPEGFVFLPGPLLIKNLVGESASVDPQSLSPFEVSEDQAHAWAKEGLGQALGEVRGAVDGKLTEWRQKLDAFNRSPVTEDSPVTPNTVSALCDLLKELPGVLSKSLSKNEQRVGEAREVMTSLQKRLKEAGIELDERFTDFPDRLAKLRKDAEHERATGKPSKKGPPSDKR